MSANNSIIRSNFSSHSTPSSSMTFLVSALGGLLVLLITIFSAVFCLIQRKQKAGRRVRRSFTWNRYVENMIHNFFNSRHAFIRNRTSPTQTTSPSGSLSFSVLDMKNSRVKRSVSKSPQKRSRELSASLRRISQSSRELFTKSQPSSISTSVDRFAPSHSSGQIICPVVAKTRSRGITADNNPINQITK